MYLKCVHLASAFIHTYIEELSKPRPSCGRGTRRCASWAVLNALKVLFFPFTFAVRAQKGTFKMGGKALKTLNTCELVIRDRDRHQN